MNITNQMDLLILGPDTSLDYPSCNLILDVFREIWHTNENLSSKCQVKKMVNKDKFQLSHSVWAIRLSIQLNYKPMFLLCANIINCQKYNGV